MSIGIGGSTAEIELNKLQDMTADITPIGAAEYSARIARAQKLMQEKGIDALYLNAGTSMSYFTGTDWHPSERMVGALLPASGALTYIAPMFEIGTLELYMGVKGAVRGWEEHESPYLLFKQMMHDLGLTSGTIAVDESTPYFISNGIALAAAEFSYINGVCITAACRQIKSTAEIALMQRAKDMTLEVQKAAARILRPGITTGEIADFINQAHIKVGAPKGSYFVIVLFGEDSAFPHGVKNPKALAENDMVLIDTGCELHGYISDITRTYVYGTPNERQRQIWDIEKAAQAAAFAQAQVGSRCGDVDLAARACLADYQLGPDYKLPGLPHRTGHGIGMDIHEWPYLNSGDDTLLKPGMCFSNEPMICVPGEFGVRLEDHFYMTEDGPKWFTVPSHSIDDPFGYEA
ncbi:M24 family metallopeptidase [Paremcibacter congregatus]|uniref:M24 family metallopeptidase n=1 Tax=Paremcibacter congregatus TaxID=2043170 RepID=UPI003A938721